MAEASALLARFAPGPDRTGRVVLHPRLTIVPLDRDDFEGLRGSFATDVPVRAVTAADVTAADVTGGASAEERAAALDAAIRDLEEVGARHVAASAAVAAAERRLQDARIQLDRLAIQRARADDVVSAASERLIVLEGAGVSATDLHFELDAAREAVHEAMAELHNAQAAVDTATPPDVAAAEAKLAEAERALAAIEAERSANRFALDSASHQLKLWAAQRAVEVEKFEVERARRRTTSEHGAREKIEGAQRAVDAATARYEAAERALAEHDDNGVPSDPAEEAVALRQQIDAVSRSITEAETRRGRDVNDAQQAVDTARREAAVAQRQLAVAVDRLEPGTDARHAAALLERTRARRAALANVDISDPESLLRLYAEETSAPILVLVEPFDPVPDGLLDALVAISATKRIVYVTDDETVLAAARGLDPEIGAVRAPLTTGGLPSPALAQADGNLL